MGGSRRHAARGHETRDPDLPARDAETCLHGGTSISSPPGATKALDAPRGAATQRRAPVVPPGTRREVLMGLTAVAVLGLPTLAYPSGADQATFAMVGDGWFHGFLPYLDRWDVKPPGIFLVYGLARFLLGEHWWSIRALDLAWTLATCLALYTLSTRYEARKAGMAAMVLYGGHLLIQPPWDLGQTDGMAVLPVLGAAILFTDALRAATPGVPAPTPPPRFRRALLRAATAGALLGTAVLLKTPAVLFGMVLLGIAALHTNPSTPIERRQGSIFGAMAAGFTSILLATTIYFFAAGAGTMFLETLFVWAPKLAWGSQPPFKTLLSDGVVLAQRNLWSVPLLAGAAAVATVSAAIQGRLRRLTLPLLLLGAGAAMTVMQFKFYRYHWMACLPGLALLAGHGLSGAWTRARHIPRPGTRRTATMILLVVTAMALPLDTARPFAASAWLAARISGHMDDVTYYQQFFKAGSRESYNFAEDVVVGRYVRERTTAQDTLFVWGFEPPIYLESGCAPASRFIYHYPVAARWTPEAWRNTLYLDLKRHAPAYFVVSHKGSAPWMTGRKASTEALLEYVPRVRSLLEREYRLETTIGAFDLYRRKR